MSQLMLDNEKIMAFLKYTIISHISWRMILSLDVFWKNGCYGYMP